MDDRIRVRGLMFHCSILGSPWPSVNVESPARTQPITVSVDIQHDIRAAAQSDDVALSIDYSKVSKNVEKACGLLGVDGPVSDTPYDLTERILEFVLRDLEHPTGQIDVDLELPKMVLRAKGAGVKLSWRPGEERKKRHSFFIIELPVHAIVGIRSYEREYKQPVVVNIEFDDARQGRRNLKFDFAELEYRISEFIEASAYGTIEALGQELVRRCFVWLKDPASFKVTVRLEKPAAVISAQAPEIKITRTSSDFPLLTAELYDYKTTGKTFAALALGANLGDRFQNIELAIRYLEDLRSLPLEDLPVSELEVVSTSFLYESPPQYLEEQPAFINCACLVETTLSPCDLLRVCKYIERTVGRIPSERFGPRAIDIDIVTYGDYTFDSRAPGDRASLDNLEGHLVIPHPRMKEREFVLRPLKDIIPEWVHPLFHRSVRSLLAQLMSEGESSTLVKVLPFPISQDLHPSACCKGPATLTYWTLPHLVPNMSSQIRKNRLRKTYIMATLNVTPDSFSDGGENKTLEIALAYAKRAVDAGADIIDIGGYSTRPGALNIPASEEIDRVVPVIQAIRSSNVASLRAIPISIDTFRVNVAKAALSAGANLINDVYAFNGGPEYPSNASTVSHFIEMRKLAHDASVPVVMMHSRGDAGQNKDYSDYKAAGFKQSVLEGVRAELGRKILRATEGTGALRRWQVIADPGIGFSKDLDGNLYLLRNASSLIADISLPPMTSSLNTHRDSIPKSPYTTLNWNPLAGFPLLVGASRKSFLGTLLLRNHVLAHDDARAGNDLSDGSGSRVKGEERPARERDFATAAAVTCAVGQGTSVVRVHAVEEMIDVVQVATALYYES